MRRPTASDRPLVSALSCAVYKVPTDKPEADGTIAWTETVVVVVEARAGDERGTGWTYSADACKPVVDGQLREAVVGKDALAVPALHEAMVRHCRNVGRPGLVGAAISATDIALWDLKARLLGLPLADLFGRCRDDAPVYGSGGFTTYDDPTTVAQLEHWTGELGIPRVKIKVGESWGTVPGRDLERVRLTRQVIGDDVELYVDANGAYTRKEAIRLGRRFVEDAAVSWFEEPVSSDDLAGLHEIRGFLSCDVAAGEYGYDEPYFARMVEARAVDCLQVDVTRCGGYTSWLRAAAIAAANGLQVSAHCAPHLHAPVAVAVPNLRHIEYFHDHERADPLLFEGCPPVRDGALCPEHDAPGHGMVPKEAEDLRLA